MRFLYLYFSIFLFLVSSGVSYVAYAKILARETYQSPLLGAIIPGNHEHVIKNGAVCIGSINTSVTEEDGTVSIEGRGQVSVTLRGVTEEVSLSYQAYFNSLKQLGGSALVVKALDTTVTVGTINIIPIDFRIIAKQGGQTFRHELSLPGPLMIAKNKDGSFRIEYDHLQSIEKLFTASAGQPLLRGLSPEIVEQGSPESECSIEQQGSLDLTTPMSALQRLMGGFG